MALGTAAVLGIAASAAGGVASIVGSSKAAKAQKTAAKNQLQLDERMYDETVARERPFYNSGAYALKAVKHELGFGDKPKGYKGYEETPGYKWQLGEGVNALDMSAASRGNVFSGATQKAQIDYGQGMAAQDYGNYFDRLMGLTGIGQAAAGNLATAGQNFSSSAGRAYGAIGNAGAAGAVGGANAINGAIGNGIGIWQYQNALSRPQSPTPYPTPPPSFLLPRWN